MKSNKLFIFDVETNGLYGEGFAVGAVVYQEGKEVARFDGIAEINTVDNPWVIENVLPHLEGLTVFESRKAMRDGFWEFWIQHKDGALCFSDVGSPVESHFFRQCVEDDFESRQWNGPYPLHEVATVLLMKGIDPDVSRTEFSGFNGKTHNPVDDAIASAMCLLKTFEL